MIRGKKADAYTMFWWIVNFIILIIVFVLGNMVIAWFGNISLEDAPAKGATLINRIYYSPHGFTYTDGIRSYPGIVDPQKFTDQSLSQSINFTQNKVIAAKVLLYDEQFKEYAEPIYLNREGYNRWIVLASFSGKGATDRSIETRTVLIWDPYREQFLSGFLTIDVVMPGS